MNSLRARKKKTKKALRDENLQKALDRASTHHHQKFSRTTAEIPWEDYKERARAIRKECVAKLPELIQQFSQEAEKAGAHVYQVSTPRQAVLQVEKILGQKKAKLIVKAKSMVSEEIALNSHLEKKGYRVVETDLGEWIVQLAGEKPSHITAPALHKTKEEIAQLLSRHLRKSIPPDSKQIVEQTRSEMRRLFFEADVGISGANLAIAESGTLAIVSNEGNARLVTSLPPVHIALVTTEKFVETMEQAVSLIKALTAASSGMKLTAYVSFITGPSRTTDIEKEMVIGVHGPQEVHIIILDNKRLSISTDDDLNEILYCLKCGGCLLVCPVFQAVGGHVFGGPVYPGGIGTLLTAITHSHRTSSRIIDFCADCKKCEEFCPVGIPIGDLILKLKSEKGPKLWEKVLSAMFGKKAITSSGARIFSFLQKPWQEDGYLDNLPLPWTKGKSIPAIQLKKPAALKKGKGEKVYLFEGCLAKFFFPEIRESVVNGLSRFGLHVICPSDQSCCGAPSYHLGDKKGLERLAQKNLKSFEKENPSIILTVCPTGNSMLKQVYPKLDPKLSRWADKTYDFTEFVSKRGYVEDKPEPDQKEEILYHYPCHTLKQSHLREEPKKVLKGLGFSPKLEDDPLTCCGFCGVFSLKNREISSHLWEKKRGKIEKIPKSLVATDCPGCLFQLRTGLKEKGKPQRVFHTAELFGRAMEKKGRNSDSVTD